MIGGSTGEDEAAHGHHAGDLGTIYLDRDGSFPHVSKLHLFALASGPNLLLNADGASMEVHADADKNDRKGTSSGSPSAYVVQSA